MKAKLLKKIRKRFEIQKVVSVGTDQTLLMSNFLSKKKSQLPFYIVFDDDEEAYNKAFQEEQEAMNYIISIVRNEYGRFGKNKNVTERVWPK